jgi:sugar/nucleoside kinase (ribokinase family)
MKIITIGSAIHDLFIEYVNPQTMAFEIDGDEVMYLMLEEGRKHEIKELHAALGGGAANSARCFKRLSFSVATCSKIGNDHYGQFVLEQLKQSKIDTALIVTSKKAQTGTAYILPSPSGNKALLVDRGANLTFEKKDMPVAKFKECDQLYITSLSRDTSELLPYITEQAKKAGIGVAANPGTSQLTVNVTTLVESLKNIDVLILNAYECSLLMEQLTESKKNKTRSMRANELPDLLSAPIVRDDFYFTLQDYFKKVCSSGPKLAVVTNGEDGVYVCDGTQILYHPSLPIDVVSTVGAGDAFGATFVSQLLKKKSVEDAIRAGIINSAAVLEHFDATTGLLDQKELDELVEEIDQNGIKRYSLK